MKTLNDYISYRMKAAEDREDGKAFWFQHRRVTNF